MVTDQPQNMMMNMYNQPNMNNKQNSLLNYKIVKCKNWEKDKTCKYGMHCTFAHGEEELRNKADNLYQFNPGFPYMMPMMIPSGQIDMSQMQQFMGNNPAMMEDEKYHELMEKITSIKDIKNKATSLFKENKLDEAIEEYTKLLDFDPNNKNFNSIILGNRALCYKKQNKLMEALKDSNESLKLNPNYVTGYIRRGRIYNE